MSSPPPPHSDAGWSHPGEPGAPGESSADAEPRYAIGALLGQGGMGRVHAARDHVLGRDVALKELQPTRGHDLSARARLAREAAITARLDHPGIVAVYEAGALPDGRPYYTMRLVRGRSLADASPEEEPRRRLRHLLAATEAVAAAHDAGIVHRDLKPTNILVGAHGETQVVDWGLASPTPAAERRWRKLPGSSARGPVGTDRYMSPEQRAGASPDPRDDVYSLGVTLQEVLGDDLDAELAAVAARATAAAPDQRYPDAGALAADLEAWFDGRRVSAHQYSPTELLRRAAQAYRLPLAVGAVGGLAVLAALGVGFVQKAAALDRALAAEAAAAERLADVQLEQAVEATRSGQRERAERLALDVLRHREDPLARGVFASFGRAERPALVAEVAAPRCRWSLLPPGGSWVACGTDGAVARVEGGRVVWTRQTKSVGGELQGDTLYSWDTAGALLAVDAATGESRGAWPRPIGDWQTAGGPRAILTPAGLLDTHAAPASGCQGRFAAAAASATGRVALLCDQGRLFVGDAADPGRLRVDTAISGEHTAGSVAWTPAGDLLVGSIRGRVSLVGADGTLRSTGETDLGLLSQVVVAPDGVHAALVGAGGRIGLWRIDTATLVAELESGAHAVAFTSEGLMVHTGGDAPALRTWRLPSGAPAVVRAPTGLADLVPAPDGERVALAGGDGFAATVDLRDGHLERWSFGHRVVKAATFAGSVPWFTALDEPRLGRGDPGGVLTPAVGRRPLRRLAALSDGGLLGLDFDFGVYRWASPDTPPERVHGDRTFLDLERDGDRSVLLDGEGGVWRVEGGAMQLVTTDADVHAVALRDDVLYLAKLDAVEAGSRRYLAPGARLLDVAVSADGARVAASALDGRVWVWDAATTTTQLVLPAHHERTVAVEFLLDGDLATASWDATARFHDLAAIDAPVAALAEAVRAAWGDR